MAETGGADKLRELGILAPDKTLKNVFRFAGIMIGPDENYTRTLMNAALGVFREEGAVRLAPAVLAEHLKTAMMHEIRLMTRPVVQERAVLWHIIEHGVIPPSQHGTFSQDINKYYEKSSGRERVFIVRSGQNIEWAMKKIREISERNDETAVYDVALSEESHIEDVPAEIKKMLIFKKEKGTGFVQIEGVIAALCALHIEDGDRAIEALIRIYRAVCGKHFNGNIPTVEALNDPRKFAREFVFHLPPAREVPLDAIPNLKERQFELMTAV